MKLKNCLLLFLAVMLLCGSVLVDVGSADSGSKRHKRRFLPPVDNALYSEECASCHFLYLPGLLPAGSWTKVMEGAEDHFGEDLALETETSTEILKYLKANSAETTGAKRSVKIMKSLKGETPLRITEIRYIVKEHREIRSKVFTRESIGSFSNCGACHRTADKGIFEEDDIKIPRK
ncbi:MAG: diheme cytochrome c [Proteobacteria bacterium]|nr:diheme cytochrome c [Pseudomonadota bacterium]